MKIFKLKKKRVRRKNQFFSFSYKNIKPEKNPTKKYITLLFSDRKGKPSIHFKPSGFGGFAHNEFNYLHPLVKMAKILMKQYLSSNHQYFGKINQS